MERFAAHLGSLVVAMRGLLLLLALAAGARYIQTLYFFLLFWQRSEDVGSEFIPQMAIR